MNSKKSIWIVRTQDGFFGFALRKPERVGHGAWSGVERFHEITPAVQDWIDDNWPLLESDVFEVDLDTFSSLMQILRNGGIG